MYYLILTNQKTMQDIHKLHKKADIIKALEGISKSDYLDCPKNIPCTIEHCCFKSCTFNLYLITVGSNGHLAPKIIEQIKETKQPHHFRTVKSAHDFIVTIIDKLNQKKV